MKSIIKIIWILSAITVSLSMIWFLIGSTACFQRKFDLVRTVVFLVVWLPAFSLVILSVLALKKGWFPVNVLGRIGMVVAVIVLSLIFVTTLIRNTSMYGWIKESVVKDYTQTTIDEKYEYRLELVNVFQRNSYARIYIKNIVNGEETTMPLDIPIKEKNVIIGGEGYISSETDVLLVWSKMMPSDAEDIYILTTTDFFDRESSYCFRIDMKDKSAKMN